MNNKSLLLIIDLQKNFINNETENCLIRIKKLLSSNKYNYIAFTKFINDENSPFYKILNWQDCMTEDDRKIMIETNNYKIFEKRTYTAVNDELKQYINENKIKDIYLCGIDTDACVLKITLDLFDSGYNVKVIENCTMSHSGQENHDIAIHLLKKLIGKDNVINEVIQ